MSHGQFHSAPAIRHSRGYSSASSNYDDPDRYQIPWRFDSLAHTTPEMEPSPLANPNLPHHGPNDAMDSTKSSTSIKPDATSLDTTLPPPPVTEALFINKQHPPLPLQDSFPAPPNHQHHHLRKQPSKVLDSAETIGCAVSTAPINSPPATAAASPAQDHSSFPVAHTPIKRKPLSARASSLAATFVHSPSPSVDLPKPDHRFSRSPSVDSPILYGHDQEDYYASVLDQLPAFEKLDFDFDRAGTVNPQISSDANIPHGSSTDGHSDILSDYDDLASQQTSPDLSTASPLTDRQAAAIAAAAQPAETPTKSFRLPMFAPKPLPPQLKLDKVNTSPPQKPLQSPIESATAKVNKPLPKSPSQGSSVIANIFNWGNTSPSATEFSSIPSPSTPGHTASSTKTLQPADPSTKSNVANNPLGYCESYLSTPPPHANAASVQLEEMEDELKAISSELASSIRREIDLEDLVDRLQEQVNNPQAPGKRTSDYFSDSGYSSAKLSDYDQSREEIEKIQRRSEQEKASLRLELTNKLQDERSKRKALDQQVRELQDRASQMDLAEMNNMDANGRLKELENTCEDLRRKLGDERQSKINFEDLLSALKNELNDAANERDNLRDEVVPQLRARVEGLEAEAASYANLTYESTKMQHQLQSLQQENSTLRSSTAGMDDILARSMPRPAIPGRNDSTKNLQSESREALAERLKDVEAQRDALHNALKNLLERQEFQNRENQKKIKILEKERSRLLGENPKKAGFERDITKLRTEVNTLRRRAEDALEQKWQVEKGLGGLKMDLDRAEEEITTLRGLLKEKDILMPQAGEPATGVTSESLQKAYDDLQAQYNESIERIKQLEVSTNDEGTRMALQRLEKSLNAALSAKDGLPATTDGLQSEYDNMSPGSAQRPLADELSESANRVELLASHVRSQLATNAELRQRLSDAISRGESQSKANSGRIAELQERLRGLEDELVTAQSSSEDRIGRHEEEITRLKEAHNEQLRRLHQGGSVGMTGPRKSPILNSAAGSVFARAENMASKSVEDETQVKKLRERVSELERALSDTENEMQEVVGKMNSAQIEVMTLQEERETAIRETKRLQALVKQEASSPFASSLRMFGMAA